jgi:hypothetical protein
MNKSKIIKFTVIILLILLAYFYFPRYKCWIEKECYFKERFIEGVYEKIKDFFTFIHNFFKDLNPFD